ncbi:MAG: thiamine pyrophosphate-dependent enzyme [bacterium]
MSKAHDRLDGKQKTLAVGVLQVRYWQHLVNENLKKNGFPVPVHVAFGHEAVAVALCAAMQPPDSLILSHRNIEYNLARAGALQPVWDEYMRLPTGAGAGRLGSMNLTNPERGILYTSSILGNNFGVACGVALGYQLANKPGVVTVLTGDGAMEEGTFYESLVLARSLGLKCQFVVENNNHALASTIEQRRCPIDIEHLCNAVEVPYLKLSGNSVFDYAAKLDGLRETIVGSSAPACVEVDLTTMNRHAGATPGWSADPMNVDLQRGLIIREDDSDPVYVLKQELAPACYAEIEQLATAQKGSA